MGETRPPSPEQEKGLKMANCLFAVVLALFATCLQAQEITENALYVSEMWQSGSRAVIVRAQGE